MTEIWPGMTYVWSGMVYIGITHVWAGHFSHMFPTRMFNIRMNRVTQFVSFTSIMSISMVCLAVMLLLLAQGTQHPVAVQVTFYPSYFLLTW